MKVRYLAPSCDDISLTSRHNDLTSRHQLLTSQHKYLTSRHNYLTIDGRNMPPYNFSDSDVDLSDKLMMLICQICTLTCLVVSTRQKFCCYLYGINL